MLHTLSSRLLVTHLLVAVVALSLVGVLSSQLFRHYYVARIQASLEDAAEDMARILARLMDEPDAAEQVALVTQATSRVLGGRVCVFDAKHSGLLASSEPGAAAGGAPSAHSLKCEAEACARIEHTQVRCYPGPVISVVAPIRDPKTSEQIGVVLLRRPLEEVEATLRLSSYLVGLSGAVAAGLALLLAALLSRAIARPLAQMAQAAADIAEGDFSARVERRGPLELRAVAASLNHMAAELSAAFADLTGERERLADILASMEEGVVGLDREGRVLLANDSARELLGCVGEDCAGRPFAELLNDPAALAELAEVLDGERDTSERIAELGDRAVRLHASRVKTDEGGAVVVIADVTEAERLERMRREFVANASHELRAPLTSIQGFLGAVSDGTADTDEEKRRCVRVAAQQAETMRRLVDQLLDLSRLQAGVAQIEPEELDLLDVARGAIESLSPQAVEKGVQVKLEADTLPTLRADGDRMMQVLVNLIDNAIRFSPTGGEVVVAASADGEESSDRRVIVSVRDRGPGIPEADLPLIWERFHKADKSRRRTDGGAGLGLAIAKEVILAHGGEVHAENSPLGGAVLSFTLPIA